MRHRLPNRILLSSIGILLAGALAAAVAVTPAWSADEAAGEAQAVHAEADSLAKPSAEPMDAAPENATEEHAAEDHTTEGHGAAGHAEAENVGFPQLNAKSYPSQLFWLFVTFTLLYVLMSKMALPRVGSVLEQRREQREGNLSRAEQLQEEASKAKTAYEAALAKAQESAQEALSAAENAISEKLAAENAKFAEQARKRIAAAEQNIAKAKADAMGSLADISADISVEIASKVAAVQVTKSDAKKVVTDLMKKEAA